MARVLLLTGGPDHAHDFAATGGALAGLLTDAGHSVETVDHPDRATESLATGDHDALVVNALRWRMLGERYDAWRDEWGYATNPALADTVAAYVHAGGGLVGNHTASICFDDWPGWRDVLGGTWNWERSWHPEPGPVHATVAAEHPVTDGLGDGFDVVDEVYGDLDLADAIDVVATAPRRAGDAPQPIAWVHHHGDGRVVYDALGHDAASLHHPSHTRLLRQAVAWVTEAH